MKRQNILQHNTAAGGSPQAEQQSAAHLPAAYDSLIMHDRNLLLSRPSFCCRALEQLPFPCYSLSSILYTLSLKIQALGQLWPIVTIIPKREFVLPPTGFQLIMVSRSLAQVILLLILQKQLVWR